MADNLKVTHYNDGSEISYTSDEDWGSYDEGQYGIYDNDVSNADIYGNLYNWAVVNDERGVCPEGFHVPSDAEFMELEIFFGMSEVYANSCGWNRVENERSILAGNSELWSDGNLENNPDFGTSGFNGLPTGYRDHTLDGFYFSLGEYGSFWTSSYGGGDIAWFRRLGYVYSSIARFNYWKQDGFSVRCVGD